MAQIIRGTTPTIEFTFSQIDVSNLMAAIMTIKQSGEIVIEKDLSDAEVGEASVAWELTQAECLELVAGNCRIMLNWLLNDETRGASNEYSVDIVPNHIAEVIT